jgi:EAL domain-containing protein (putative c-di-GMP-specific phosphodiesterase class I)
MIALLKPTSPQNDNVASYNLVPSLFSEHITQSIRCLIQQLNTIAIQLRSSSGSPSAISLEGWILDSICQITETEQVLRVHYDSDQKDWIFDAANQVLTHINDRFFQHRLRFLHQEIFTNYLANIDLEESPQGIYRVVFSSVSQSYKAYSLIPLDEPKTFLLIAGLSVEINPFSGEYESPFLNDTFTYLLSSFYQEACKCYDPFSDHLPNQLISIEARILDNLKERYGFMSKSLYDRRFKLFQDCLDRIEIHFEPIFDLQFMCVYGWEALARDPMTGKAPHDLFMASELWGFKFTAVLDTQLLRKALYTYRELLEGNQIPLDTLPLFVNVYPESLMASTFFDELKELTQGAGKLIESYNLTLEISEKKQLPFCSDNPRSPISLETFKQRLNEYVSKLGIGFGLDDFGVGYSSVHRFTGLNLPFIKIDREILYQEPFDAVIRFVQEMINFAGSENRSEIIVEGLDASSPISLQQLKDLGVRFVQGYLIGKATVDLNPHLRTKIGFLP